MTVPFLFAKLKPALGYIAKALQFALHFGVLCLHQVCVRSRRHVNWGRAQNHRARERRRQQKMVPGIGESFAAIHADVKYQDRTTALSRQHYWTWLGHVSRPARTVNGKAAINPFSEPLGHHGHPPEPATRRTSLSRAEPQPLDNLARPLAVERSSIEHHDAAISGPPRHRNDDAVPERKNASLSGSINGLRLLLSQCFKTKRGPQRANNAVYRGGDNRNLRAA